MAKSKKYDAKEIRYVTAKKATHTETQLAYQLYPSSEIGEDKRGRCRPRLIIPNAKSGAGEPIFVLVDGKDGAKFPSAKEDPEFSRRTAEAMAYGKLQLAYELVASDVSVDFYRVRSILRLEYLERDFRNHPVFVLVDGEHNARAGSFVPVDDLGEISHA
jgi:hypothetical protein